MIHLSLLTTLLLSLTGGPAPAPTQPGQHPSLATAPATIDSVTIPVLGMSCESCAAHLQTGLANIEGVLEAEVDFATKEARLRFDPSKTGVPALVAKVNQSFEAGPPRRGGDA